MDELRICPLNSWARPRLLVPSPSERLPNSWQHVSRIEGQLDWLPAQVLEVMLRGNWPTNANSASVNRAARPCLSELLGTAKSTSSVARGTPLRMPTANPPMSACGTLPAVRARVAARIAPSLLGNPVMGSA